jgi:hypothetical protein
MYADVAVALPAQTQAAQQWKNIHERKRGYLTWTIDTVAQAEQMHSVLKTMLPASNAQRCDQTGEPRPSATSVADVLKGDMVSVPILILKTVHCIINWYNFHY